MDYSLYLARKLSLSTSGGKRSPAVVVATTAVALSIAVMLAAVAIVGGFKEEIRDKVIGFNSHLTISVLQNETDGDNLVSLTPSLRKILDEEEYVSDYALEVTMPAVLKTPEDFKGVYFKALTGASDRAFIERHVVSGHVPDTDVKLHPDSAVPILLSQVAADKLRLSSGEKVDVYFISDGIRVRRMKIAGVFNTHFDAYDDVSVYGPKSLVDELAGLSGEKGTALHVTTTDFNRVQEFGSRLAQRLMSAYSDGEVYRVYQVETALERGRNYFSWLSLLDTNVIVVLVLMTIVGVITLVSGLLIIILDKISFIGMMKALGASNRALGRVFIYLALKVTLSGLLIGNGLMLTFLWLQDRLHLIPLDPDSYYIDFVPVQFNWEAIMLLNVGVFVVVWLSLILPSRFVARISPSSTMRYE